MQACHCQMQTSSLDFDPAAERSIKRAIKAGNSLLVISGKLQKTIPKPALIFSDNLGQLVWKEQALKTSAKPAPRNGTSKDAVPGTARQATIADPTCVPDAWAEKSLPLNPTPKSPVVT